VFSREATDAKFIVFGLTLPWFEQTIYRTGDELADKHYANNSVTSTEDATNNKSDNKATK
jgi:hypothetical protein